jgi:hypothetical protein
MDLRRANVYRMQALVPSISELWPVLSQRRPDQLADLVMESREHVESHQQNPEVSATHLSGGYTASS